MSAECLDFYKKRKSPTDTYAIRTKYGKIIIINPNDTVRKEVYEMSISNKYDSEIKRLDDKVDLKFEKLNDKIDSNFTISDNKIDNLEASLNNKIDNLEASLNNKIDNLEKKIDSKFNEAKSYAENSLLSFKNEILEAQKATSRWVIGAIGVPVALFILQYFIS